MRKRGRSIVKPVGFENTKIYIYACSVEVYIYTLRLSSAHPDPFSHRRLRTCWCIASANAQSFSFKGLLIFRLGVFLPVLETAQFGARSLDQSALKVDEVDELERSGGVGDAVGPVHERVTDGGHDLHVLKYLWLCFWGAGGGRGRGCQR